MLLFVSDAPGPDVSTLLGGSAAATQLGGGILGTAVVLLLVYLQYKRRPSTLDGKAESAGIAMIEAIRVDAADARKDAAEAMAELRERDRLARVHEAYDRKILNALSRAGLLDDEIGVPPPLTPHADEEK